MLARNGMVGVYGGSGYGMAVAQIISGSSLFVRLVGLGTKIDTFCGSVLSDIFLRNRWNVSGSAEKWGDELIFYSLISEKYEWAAFTCFFGDRRHGCTWYWEWGQYDQQQRFAFER